MAYCCRSYWLPRDLLDKSKSQGLVGRVAPVSPIKTDRFITSACKALMMKVSCCTHWSSLRYLATNSSLLHAKNTTISSHRKNGPLSSSNITLRHSQPTLARFLNRDDPRLVWHSTCFFGSNLAEPYSRTPLKNVLTSNKVCISHIAFRYCFFLFQRCAVKFAATFNWFWVPKHNCPLTQGSRGF